MKKSELEVSLFTRENQRRKLSRHFPPRGQKKKKKKHKDCPQNLSLQRGNNLVGSDSGAIATQGHC